MADKPTGTKKITLEQALEKTKGPVRNCATIPDDKAFYAEETGKCIVKDYCPFRRVDDTCRRYGQTRTGDTSTMQRAVQEQIPPPSTDLCYEGGKQYLRHGFCIAASCKFQTAVKLPVKTTQGEKEMPKCIAHCIEGCIIDGDKSLFIGTPACCMATGKAECEHQVKEISDNFRGVPVVYCKKYEV
jgi:hypothetical protein